MGYLRRGTCRRSKGTRHAMELGLVDLQSLRQRGWVQ